MNGALDAICSVGKPIMEEFEQKEMRNEEG